MLIPVSIDNSTLAGVALATTRAPAALYSSALRADSASLNFVSASGTSPTSVPHSARWYSLSGCLPPSMRRSSGTPKTEPAQEASPTNLRDTSGSDATTAATDRKSVVEGTCVSVRLDLGLCRNVQKNNNKNI